MARNISTQEVWLLRWPYLFVCPKVFESTSPGIPKDFITLNLFDYHIQEVTSIPWHQSLFISATLISSILLKQQNVWSDMWSRPHSLNCLSSVTSRDSENLVLSFNYEYWTITLSSNSSHFVCAIKTLWRVVVDWEYKFCQINLRQRSSSFLMAQPPTCLNFASLSGGMSDTLKLRGCERCIVVTLLAVWWTKNSNVSMQRSEPIDIWASVSSRTWNKERSSLRYSTDPIASRYNLWVMSV